MDMSMRSHNGGNALVETDYIVTANKVCPMYVAQWLNGIPGRTPDVNPLYRQPGEIRGLNPQLILVGAGEFALQDSKDLAELCSRAQVPNQLICEWGQLHIYALGSAWLEPAVRRKTDATIMSWMKQCLGGANPADFLSGRGKVDSNMAITSEIRW
jgi:acetyl esterase/lipase